MMTRSEATPFCSIPSTSTPANVSRCEKSSTLNPLRLRWSESQLSEMSMRNQGREMTGQDGVSTPSTP